jgi:Immunity protein 63
MKDPSSDSKSRELQAEIDRLATQLGVHPITVGLPLRTTDDLNIYVDDDGTYHYAYYERGKPNFDRTGSLDDILYWYCSDLVGDRAAHEFRDRRYRFADEYRVLSAVHSEWGKRRVRELAAQFRKNQPNSVELLPDIGEPL